MTKPPRKRPPAAAPARRDAKPENDDDPADLWRRAQARHDESLELEARAIRLALEQAQGFEVRAADLIGVNRNTFRRLIRPGGRHAAIGEHAATLRAATGYRGGNPRLSEK